MALEEFQVSEQSKHAMKSCLTVWDQGLIIHHHRRLTILPNLQGPFSTNNSEYFWTENQPLSTSPVEGLCHFYHQYELKAVINITSLSTQSVHCLYFINQTGKYNLNINKQWRIWMAFLYIGPDSIQQHLLFSVF